MREYDPAQPFVAKDHLEYANYDDYLLGRPTNCERNRYILRNVSYSLHESDPEGAHPTAWYAGIIRLFETIDHWCADRVFNYDRNNRPRTHATSGDGGESSFQASPGAIHPAHQSEVPRWLGA
jgi:hypothetical protein